MPRFDSLGYTPSETRRILRDRLRRNLSTSRNERALQRAAFSLTDESALKLLLDVEIRFEGDVATARANYEALRLVHPGAPEFDQLVASGLVRVVLGRLYSGLDTTRTLAHANDDLRAALGPVLERRHRRQFLVGPIALHDPGLSATVTTMQSSPDDVHHLDCAAPEWVAARLWERLPKTLAPVDRLRRWLDLCDLLPDSSFAPTRVWSSTDAEEFRDAALSMLGSEAAIIGWTEERERLIARLAVAWDRPASEVERRVHPAPIALVDRYLWLRSPEHGRDDYEAWGVIWRLADFLLRDAQEVDGSAAPHPVAYKLLGLAIDRPELVTFIGLWTRQRPAVLADLLLDPSFSALACLLIAEWSLGGGAWDRDLTARDDRAARLVAFTDAVAVSCHFLAAGSVAPQEFSALLSWMHGKVNQRHYVTGERQLDERMLLAVRSELVVQSEKTLRAVAEACVAASEGVESPSFAAALDVVALGLLADVIPPEPVVTRYIGSVRDGRAGSGQSLDASAARALVQLARRTSSELWAEFLSPLNVLPRLAKADEAGANPYTISDEIARSIRTHVRTLSRAVAAWEEPPPPDLVRALVRTVRTGALTHAEKGRVGAFSARFEHQPFGELGAQPIAVDLGAALTALEDSNRDELLRAILETDEPLMLAQLVAATPHSLRDRIRNRINDLSPSDAGDITTLPELQGRIENLISAGALDAAAKFMDVERDLRTWGRVRGRELVRLTADMKLRLLRRDFEAIANATAPSGLEQSESSEAEEIIDFYRGLAQLENPQGNLDLAETLFQQLERRRPDIVAYSVNLLGVRASRMLAGNLFGRLRGVEAAGARGAIADANATMTRWRGANDSDLALHQCNIALLLLATGQPERAYAMLDGLGNAAIEDRIAAYSAVALARMGRGADAVGALDRAERLFGDSEILRAARAQILRAAPLDARASAATTDDAVTRVKAALGDLSLMDPSRQAAVFHSGPDADEFIVAHVRAAAASVIALVPMMKVVELDSCEDDLTAVVRAVLSQRFEVLHWSWADQSKGGFTDKGNPGERDLVLRKDDIVLAVLEAVVCDRPITHEWAKSELASHFQKLLGYATCRLFFHITYSYVADPGAVLNELRRQAELEAPAGFTFRSRRDITLSDSRPTGFVATYGYSLGQVKVVFLLMDMGQRSQRGAAKMAASNNPRTKKKSP